MLRFSATRILTTSGVLTPLRCAKKSEGSLHTKPIRITHLGGSVGCSWCCLKDGRCEYARRWFLFFGRKYSVRSPKSSPAPFASQTTYIAQQQLPLRSGRPLLHDGSNRSGDSRVVHDRSRNACDGHLPCGLSFNPSSTRETSSHGPIPTIPEGCTAVPLCGMYHFTCPAQERDCNLLIIRSCAERIHSHIQSENHRAKD